MEDEIAELREMFVPEIELEKGFNPRLSRPGHINVYSVKQSSLFPYLESLSHIYHSRDSFKFTVDGINEILRSYGLRDVKFGFENIKDEESEKVGYSVDGIVFIENGISDERNITNICKLIDGNVSSLSDFFSGTLEHLFLFQVVQPRSPEDGIEAFDGEAYEKRIKENIEIISKSWLDLYQEIQKQL